MTDYVMGLTAIEQTAWWSGFTVACVVCVFVVFAVAWVGAVAERRQPLEDPPEWISQDREAA